MSSVQELVGPYLNNQRKLSVGKKLPWCGVNTACVAYEILKHPNGVTSKELCEKIGLSVGSVNHSIEYLRGKDLLGEGYPYKPTQDLREFMDNIFYYSSLNRRIGRSKPVA